MIINIFGKETQFHHHEPLPRFQGRSTTKLHPTVRYQGGIYVAQFEGRRERFFGDTPEVALKNLKAGAA